jgi:hypothetical protein
MPDGLVLVGQDHLVRRVVEQVVKRLFLLDLILDVVLPVVESPEGIDGPLVLGPHLDIVPMFLPSARDRRQGPCAASGAPGSRHRAFWAVFAPMAVSAPAVSRAGRSRERSAH